MIMSDYHGDEHLVFSEDILDDDWYDEALDDSWEQSD